MIDHKDDLWTRVLTAFVTFLACWTLFCHLAVLGGAGYEALLVASWIPFAVGIILMRYLPALRGPGASPSPEPAFPQRPRARESASWLFVAAAVSLLYLVKGWYLLFWLAAAAYLAVFLRSQPLEPAPADSGQPIDGHRGRPWVHGAVCLLMSAAVVVTLVSHRPDIDDAFYLNLAVTAMDHPQAPLYSFDGMHGEDDLPLLGAYYRLNSYELLAAVVASVTGFAVASVYYLLLPALMAAIAVVAYWVALRAFCGRLALIGLAGTLLCLLAWGDLHRTFGNFAFVRLFQGKAILVTIGGPALFYFAARYCRYRDRYSWCCLALATAAMVGLSSSALLVAPAAVAMVLIGNWRPGMKATRTLLIGATAAAYVAIAGLAIAMSARGLVSLPRFALPDAGSTTTGLELVLGPGGRAPLAVFALLAAPLAATTADGSRTIAGTVLACLILLMNPATPDILGESVGNMSWRIFWAVPFPLCVGLCVVAVGRPFAAAGYRRQSLAVSCAFVVAFASVPGPTTLAAANRTRVGWPPYKVDPEYAVARKVVAMTPANGLVLAHWLVAAWVPTLRGHPPIVGVRPHYLGIVRSARGIDEERARAELVGFVSGEATIATSRDVLREIRNRGVTTVVVAAGTPAAVQLGPPLTALGYQPRAEAGYVIWIRVGDR